LEDEVTIYLGKCECGHSGGRENSSHDDEGHGKCKIEGCPCKNFTWVGWMPERMIRGPMEEKKEG
jgi:hypothetical protein